jgi:hypothetical protein
VGELTQPQIARLASLPDGHAVVGESEGSPLVECSDGRLVRVQPNGQLVATTLVSGVQSYLRLEPC